MFRRARPTAGRSVCGRAVVGIREIRKSGVGYSLRVWIVCAMVE